MSNTEKAKEVDGPFSAPPSADEVNEFLQFAKETGKPEAFQLLAESPSPAELDWKILARFEIPVSQRPGGSYIPCAQCGVEAKYLAGCLIWSADGHIRIIGNGCAKTHFGADSFKRAEREYRHNRIRDSKIEYLRDAWPQVGKLLEEAERLASKARQIESFTLDFRRNAPVLFNALTQASLNSSGALTVAHQSDSNIVSVGQTSSSGGASKFYEVAVSTVKGHILFKPNRRWAAKLRAAIQKIAPLLIPEGQISDNISNQSSEILIQHAHAIENAVSCIVSVHEELHSANQFICEDSALAMRKWISESDQLQRPSVTLQGPVLLIWEHGYARATINIANNPPVPNPDTAIELHERWK